VEKVKRSDTDPYGWEAAEIDATRGCGVIWNAWPAGVSAQVTRPAEPICSRVLHPKWRWSERCVDGAVIEHRVDKQLQYGMDPALVAHSQGERRSEPPAGARARDSNAVIVDVVLTSHLGEGGMAVVQRGGERVFRSEPVVNRDDDAM